MEEQDSASIEEDFFLRKRIIMKRTIVKTEIVEEFEQANHPIIKTINYKPQQYKKEQFPLEKNLESKAIDDLECRKELAKLLGLEDLPVQTPEAFAKLDGLFDDIAQPEDVDVVKWVKSLRRRKY
jgi:hypothetical protein